MGDASGDRLPLDVEGIDEILGGGLPAGRAYLVRGGPGCGKTTLGLHFLAAGRARGERCLLISLEQPEERVRQDAAGIGLDLSGVPFLDLSPSAAYFAGCEGYTIFAPNEVETQPLTDKLVRAVEEHRPQRVLVDSLTQFRYLAPDAFQFRKQVLSFLRFLLEREATVAFTSESGSHAADDDFQFLADGVVTLQQEPDGLGRWLQVGKLRGSAFAAGRHSLALTDRGLAVFPRLLPGDYRREHQPGAIASGVPKLDELLHGGLERGTATLITGPSGVGKTTLGTLFMREAAGRGERSAIFCFEEAPEILLRRSDAINLSLRGMVERGVLALAQVEPLRHSPDELARMVRREVEERGARVVMLDSVAGYRPAPTTCSATCTR